jgi:hypothetical protein
VVGGWVITRWMLQRIFATDTGAVSGIVRGMVTMSERRV